MTGDIFLAYLKQSLAPTLAPGDTVLMDSLPVHKVAGATLVYLPSYSPDFNPIEQAFSKLKSHLRKAAEETIPDLIHRIGRVVPNSPRRNAPTSSAMPAMFKPDRNLV
jgi:transposase